MSANESISLLGGLLVHISLLSTIFCIFGPASERGAVGAALMHAAVCQVREEARRQQERAGADLEENERRVEAAQAAAAAAAEQQQQQAAVGRVGGSRLGRQPQQWRWGCGGLARPAARPGGGLILVEIALLIADDRWLGSSEQHAPVHSLFAGLCMPVCVNASTQCCGATISSCSFISECSEVASLK